MLLFFVRQEESNPQPGFVRGHLAEHFTGWFVSHAVRDDGDVNGDLVVRVVNLFHDDRVFVVFLHEPGVGRPEGRHVDRHLGSRQKTKLLQRRRVEMLWRRRFGGGRIVGLRFGSFLLGRGQLYPAVDAELLAVSIFRLTVRTLH